VARETLLHKNSPLDKLHYSQRSYNLSHSTFVLPDVPIRIDTNLQRLFNARLRDSLYFPAHLRSYIHRGCFLGTSFRLPNLIQAFTIRKRNKLQDVLGVDMEEYLSSQYNNVIKLAVF